MYAIFSTIDIILNFYTYIIIGSAVFSWLYAFNIVNPRNTFVNTIGRFLYQLTEPVLGMIRRVVPIFGTIDISPIIALFAIYFLRVFLATTVAPMFGV